MKNLFPPPANFWMKQAAFIFIFLCPALSAFALTPDDLANNLKIRKATMDLVRQQRMQDSVNYLSANVRSDEKGARRDLTVAQELIGMAFGFQNHHERAEAQAAAQAALEKIQSLPHGAGRDPQMGSLFSNAGLMCERVLNDPVMAKAFYEAALSAHPSNKLAQDRMELMRHKRHDRQSDGNSGSAKP
jgi:hypothetical protein